MKFRYRFSNLLGTVYRRGDVLFSKDGNSVICPVGNKISIYDLANNRATTLPVEARYDYTAMALSPNGQLLIAAQEDGEIHVINVGFKRIIYRKRFKGKIQKISFSPCGRYFALAKLGTIFIYSTPKCTRFVYDPFSRVRVIKVVYDDVLCIDSSHDSRLLCFGSQDVSAHVYALTKFENLNRLSLGGHTDSVVGIFFQVNSYDLCSVTRNGQVNLWVCSAREKDLIQVDVKDTEEDGEGQKPTDEEDSENETQKDKAKEKMDISKKGVSYGRKQKIYLSQFLKHSMSSCVSKAAYRKEGEMLVVAFDSGDFLLLDLSDSVSLIHSLHVSNKAISSVCLNNSGDWIALGMEQSGELLVWEWQSETHVLKQKGHFNVMRVVCYSPDGSYIATGGEDGKVKIWSTQSSFCFVTFSEHSSEITGVAFTQSGRAVVSSSLDGTVRAFDMIRYRNFRTMTSTKAVQFSCVCVDSSGEFIAAGGQDVHEIFLWSMQTGKLLEILSGHSGPVVSVKFSPKLGSTTLVSTSWDKTIKVWDAIANTTAKETIFLLAEGTCVDVRNDGLQIAVSTMDGHISTFDINTLRQEKTIEGRNDLGAGRTTADKVTAKTNLKSKFFESVSYSSDGKFLLAAGKSKNVCIYSIDDELLVKKFAITQNRSLDGMDKIVSRKHLGEDGTNLSLVEDRSRFSQGAKIPGSVKSNSSVPHFNPEVRVLDLAFSNTGRCWAACTTEGLLVYSLDDDWLFDPLQLDENNTPEAVRRRLSAKQYSTALMMAVRLNINPLIMEVLEQIPLDSIPVVVDSLTIVYVEPLLKVFSNLLETSRHLGFFVVWVEQTLLRHGTALKERAPSLISDLSDLQKALTRHYDNLGKLCSHNDYTLKYLLCQAKLHKTKISESEPEDKTRQLNTESDSNQSSDDDLCSDG